MKDRRAGPAVQAGRAAGAVDRAGDRVRPIPDRTASAPPFIEKDGTSSPWSRRGGAGASPRPRARAGRNPGRGPARLGAVLQALHDGRWPFARTGEGAVQRARASTSDTSASRSGFSVSVGTSRVIRQDSDRKATLYAHIISGWSTVRNVPPPEFSSARSSWAALGGSPLRAGRALVRGPADDEEAWAVGAAARELSPWSARCRQLLELVNMGGRCHGLRRPSLRCRSGRRRRRRGNKCRSAR
jgi:hypothetical protein